MEKEFVFYKEALALKELGFDEDCLSYFDDKTLTLKANQIPTYCIAAPLWQQAFDWFEEKHGLYVDRVIITTPNEVLSIDYLLKSCWFPPITIEFEKPYDEFDKMKAKTICLEKLIEALEVFNG